VTGAEHRAGPIERPLLTDPTGRCRPFSDTRIAEFDARKRTLYLRVVRAMTAGWLTQTGFTAYHQPGPGGLPLALRLSEYEGTSPIPSRSTGSKIDERIVNLERKGEVP
jgi:hypothetical protein